MSTPIAGYSFLPWARQGLGLHIREEDQATAVKVRGSIDVSLQVTGERIGGGTTTEPLASRPVQLYGPGDIIGIDSKAIVRTEPLHWITNFESNYLPYVEFYDEDFPWRYTPAKPSPDGRRLRPWLALVVLQDSEFTEGTAGARPLPFIEVADPAQKFPPADQLWAWAHVHVNGGLGVDANDTAALAGWLDATVRGNRDLAYSRLMSARILKEDTAYHAFLIPSFETGRLAGLGLNPDQAEFATQNAWAGYAARPEPTLFPVYHRWYFHTGTVGDFEYLVRLLEPRTVDPRVGRRDFDVQAPGMNLPPILSKGGILRLGGALRAPLLTLSEDDLAEYNGFEEWGKPYPHAFQTAMAALVNLADDYGKQGAAAANDASGIAEVEADEDPLIVPPLYGRWHSLTQRLVPADGDPARKKWVQELNLDPRHRIAAGFGTQTVQQNQEEYMEASWQQVGKVLEANQKIRYGHMAIMASQVWHTRELAAMKEKAAEHLVSVSAPVHGRVMGSPVTVQHAVRHSTVHPTLLSKTLRQTLRPGARVTRRAGFDRARGLDNLLDRVNRGEVSAAPPKVVAPALPTEEKLADSLFPGGLPRAWLAWLERHRWFLFVPLALAILVLLILWLLAVPAALAIGAVLVAGALVLMKWLERLLARRRAAVALDPENQTPAAVDAMPKSSDFRLGPAGQGPAPSTGGTTDSVEAVRFKEALRNLYRVDVVDRANPPPVRRPLDLPALADTILKQLRPAVTIPARVIGSVAIPGRITEQLVEDFGEVMVYPELDVPMYEPLKSISSELFLPNIQLIGNNTITLLETNQKFIESYMVGLNHEFSRELLWREFPTDQRGSYFRQFWDVSGYMPEVPADPQVLREKLRDIPELHRWSRSSELGSHDHREAEGEKEDEVVLVIRGELLKKYPTAVIYAHRAAWQRDGGVIDKTRPRKLAPLTPAQEAAPPRDLVKTPLYEAKVSPDIYFFGFDLTAGKALGGAVVNGEEDPGWFFVIKERPGEPRFGLDLPQAPHATIKTWNELAWSDVMANPAPPAGSTLRLGEKTVTVTDPGPADPAKAQYDEDRRFSWKPDTHAAELAYILYQVPAMMAVHAAEMLEKPAEP